MNDDASEPQPTGALADLTVLEVGDEGTQACGKYLADMGATVIKVEPPTGAPSRHRGPYRGDVPDLNASLYFWAYNTSKDSITLDFERADDRAVLRELASRAEVMLEDHPPGYLDALGIGYTALSAAAPRLVVTSVTPFGQTGPLASWRGSDLIAWATGGGMSLIGYDDPDTPPLVPQGDIAYQLAGCWATIGTLVALTARDASGQGQHVDVSVQEACAFCVDGYDIAPYEYAGTIRGRRDVLGGETVITKDGKFFLPQITNVPDGRWLEFREWLRNAGEGEELHELEPAAMRADMVKVRAVVQRLADKRTAVEMYAIGQSFGFTWMAVNAPDELLDDEQLNARQFFQEVHHPELGASYIYAGPPAIWSEAAWRIRSRPPLLGEHNRKWGVRDHGIPTEGP